MVDRKVIDAISGKFDLSGGDRLLAIKEIKKVEENIGIANYNQSLHILGNTGLFPGISDHIDNLGRVGIEIFEETGRISSSLARDVRKRRLFGRFSGRFREGD